MSASQKQSIGLILPSNLEKVTVKDLDAIQPHLRQVTEDPKEIPLLVDRCSVQADKVGGMGAARLAKDHLVGRFIGLFRVG